MQTVDPTLSYTMSGTSKIIQELPTVKGLDLQRYMGRWYEIASVSCDSNLVVLLISDNLQVASSNHKHGFNHDPQWRDI